MKFFPRPLAVTVAAAVLAVGAGLTPAAWACSGEQHVTLPADDPAMLNPPSSHGAAPGYLGIDIRDVDSARAAQLKMKEAQGAEIITVDHDAPAAKAGLRVHDVILAMNSQAIAGEAQLRQLLREQPAGRTVTFVISRNGQQQTITVQLADRSTLEADAWSQHTTLPEPDETDVPQTPGPSYGYGFLSALGPNPLYTGLDLDMLGPQLANFFGVHDGQGLLVRRVDDNSPGSVAGLRAGDVITRVNGQIVATTNQWMRAIHANRGKLVQLTVFRDRKEGTVTMMAGRPKTKSMLTWPERMWSMTRTVRGIAYGAAPMHAEVVNVWQQL